jgi:methyl-accepting chemotaxis protein/methyl-accepting chemotaxis protein-1 (serine sensor receptor)
VTIGKQIGICLGGMAVACLLMGAAGWKYVSALGDRLDEAIQVTARTIQLSGELKAHVLTFRLQERGILLFSFTKADQQVAASVDAYDKAMSAALEDVRAIRPLLRTDRGRELIDQTEQGILEYKSQQLEVCKILATGDVLQAAELDRKSLVPVGSKMLAALTPFTELMQSINAQANAEAAGMKGTAELVLACGLAGCALMGLAVTWIVRGSARKLQRTAIELGSAAREVTGAASQVASSSQLLAQGCTEQAASLEQTSAASKEMDSLARKNTETGAAAADLMTQSQQKTVATHESLRQTVVAMAEINTQSGKISKIIKVIDEIAFQTNILALNAAVEAARAGEAGLGFAVVADEVRNLAQRCAQAAKDTAQLIEESIAKSQDGKSKVDQVAAAFQAITDDTARVKTLMDEVNVGDHEQSRSIDQIAKAISQMEQVTQQTAANAEESAAAAQQLNAQSAALEGIMERLTSMVGDTA